MNTATIQTASPLTKAAKSAHLLASDFVTPGGNDTFAVQSSKGGFYCVAVETYLKPGGVRVRRLTCSCRSFFYRCGEMDKGCCHTHAVAQYTGEAFVNGGDAR